MKTVGRIAALILAAGYSSRMGTFKPLLPVGRSTAIDMAVSRFREAGIEDIRVVTGYQADSLAPVLAKLGVREVFNPDYDRGMLSSILAGVKSLEKEVVAFFLLPVDMPAVKALSIKTLVQAYQDHPCAIIYPRFLGRRGHPPLISTAISVLALDPDAPGGFRPFLSEHEDAAMDVDVPDQGTLMDFDTPDGYRELRAYCGGEGIPTEAECRALWLRHGVPEEVTAHCRMVAELARILAVYLNRMGLNLNPGLAVAGGLLHDLAKGQPRHAEAGARMLRELGYESVAKIVENHTDLDCSVQPLSEAGLVHLADKYARKDKLVSLDERFGEAFERHPWMSEKITGRLNKARSISEQVKNVLGISVEYIIERHGRGIHAASFQGKREIYLLRHGAVRPSGPGKHFIGQVDLPLSPEGVGQAEALREELRHVPLSAIYCSDLLRSAETARIIAEPHLVAPIPRADLREISLGGWDGLSFEAVREGSPEQFEQRGRDMVHFRPPGGENFLDVAMRVVPALFGILHATRGNIAIVGHAGVNRIILCQALGLSLERLLDLPQDYGCVNLFQTDEPIDPDGSCFMVKMISGAEWSCKKFN
ncbi:MAG: DVU_1551 family NTP transferase [Syntrophobacter sp.]